MRNPFRRPRERCPDTPSRSAPEQAVAQWKHQGPRSDVGDTTLSRIRCGQLSLRLSSWYSPLCDSRRGLETVVATLSNRLVELDTRPATFSASAAGSTPSSLAATTNFHPPTLGYHRDATHSPSVAQQQPPPDLDLPPPDLLGSLSVPLHLQAFGMHVLSGSPCAESNSSPSMSRRTRQSSTDTTSSRRFDQTLRSNGPSRFTASSSRLSGCASRCPHPYLPLARLTALRPVLVRPAMGQAAAQGAVPRSSTQPGHFAQLHNDLSCVAPSTHPRRARRHGGQALAKRVGGVEHAHADW